MSYLSHLKLNKVTLTKLYTLYIKQYPTFSKITQTQLK